MKKVIGIILTLCMVISMLPTAYAAEARFKDVPKDMWCYDYVDYVAKKGYFGGTTATTYDPNGTFTRQQFMVVLSRMAGATVDNSQSAFTDVPVGSYSAGAIAWAAKNGIAGGRADGTFGPTEPVTRQQMCAFMVRFMNYYSKANGVSFERLNKEITFIDENEIADYAQAAVDQCVNYGLIGGYADKSFRPTAYATRAHGAAIIQRLDKATVSSDFTGGSSGGSTGGDTGNETKYKVTYTGEGGAVLKIVEVVKDKNHTPVDWSSLSNDKDFDNNLVNDKFLGWKIQGASEVTGTFKVTGDTTLVPVWDRGFTVTYKNNTTGTPAYYRSYPEYESVGYVEIDEPALDDTNDLYFKGWKVDPVNGADVTISGEKKVEVTADVIAKGLYLVADWGDVAKATVSFEGVDWDAVELNKGADYTFEDVVADVDFDGNGLYDQFKGWKIKDSSDTKIYQAGETLTVNEDTTLVAQWALCYSVTYQDADGNIVKDPDTGAEWIDLYYYYDVVPTATVRTMDDTALAFFKGWKNLADNVVYANGSSLKVEEDIVLKATWGDKDDYLLKAFSSTVNLFNDTVIGGKYEDAQTVLEIGSVKVDRLTTNFDELTDRTVYATASATLSNETIKSVVKTAALVPLAIIADENVTVKNTIEDTKKEIKDRVKAVLDALDLTWTEEEIEEIVEELYLQVKEKAWNLADAAWDNFQLDGAYIFETADVVVNGKTLFYIDAAGKCTSLGAKASSKALAEAVAKELFADLTAQAGSEADAKTAVTLKSAITLSFEGATVNPTYPTEYTLDITLNLSNDQISYWYDATNDVSHLILTVPASVRETYNNAVYSELAQEGIEYLKGQLTPMMESTLTGFIDSNESMLQQLVDFQVYADLAAAKADIKDVAEDVVADWIDANLSTDPGTAFDFFWNGGTIEIVGDTYKMYDANGDEIVGGSLFKNDDMVDALTDWANGLLTYEVETDEVQLDPNGDPVTDENGDPVYVVETKERVIDVMNSAMDDMLLAESSDPNYATIKEQYQAQIGNEAISMMEKPEYAGMMDLLINFDIYDDHYNVIDTVNLFADMFSVPLLDAAGQPVLDPTNNPVYKIEASDVAMLKALSNEKKIESFNHALTYKTTISGAPTVVRFIQNILADAVENKVDDVFDDVMNSLDDGLIKDVLNSGASVKLYVKNLAMIKMGLVDYILEEIQDIDDTKTPAENLAGVEALAVSTIKTYINDNVLTPFINKVPETIDGKVVAFAGPYTEVLNLIGKVSTYEKLTDQPLSMVAAVITSDFVSEKITSGAISNESITKGLNALAYAIEKLPAKAVITVNNALVLSEEKLGDLKAAAESGNVETVLDEVAALINQIGGLKLNNFNVPVLVEYGERSFNCELHIVLQ